MVQIDLLLLVINPLIVYPLCHLLCIIGVSLAQDRGRLEAKVEVLSTEIESLKKQNERDNDALRIKTKMVEDQTETIRKLKEVSNVSNDFCCTVNLLIRNEHSTTTYSPYCNALTFTNITSVCAMHCLYKKNKKWDPHALC